ncbi:MAG TPA: UbiD family decarboxylase [Chitinophagales bacterium]|nr:UbiD family decarboxylase [Chitinophagales bacterium]
MGYKSLQECVDDLEHHGHLVRIKEEVDPFLEMAAIHLRVYNENGPAILFENVKGSKYKAVSNLFGTVERSSFMFRDSLTKVKLLVEAQGDPMKALKNPFKYWKLPFFAIKALPKKVFRQHFNEIKIEDIPQIHCWPMDGGPFVTLPIVYTEDPDAPGPMKSNIGMYRIQLAGNDYTLNEEVGLHYQLHRGIGVHQTKYKALNKPMKVSVIVGGPPAHSFSAVMPLPEGMSELTFAGALGNRRFRYFYDENDFFLSADADFVITGEVYPGENKTEGPFGDHLGYYSLKHEFPVMRVHKVYAKKNAIWPFTVVGRPPQEDTSFGDMIHEITGSAIPKEIPGVHEVHAVDAAGVHPLLLVLGSERYTPYYENTPPQEILTIANHILGTGQLSLAKWVFIAAKQENVPLSTYDLPQFYTHVLERVDWKRDVHFYTKTTIDTLDYSGSSLNAGSKVVIAAAGQAIRTLSSTIAEDFKFSEIGQPHFVMPGVLSVQASAFTTYTNAKVEIEEFAAQIENSGLEKWTGIPLIIISDDSEFTAKDMKNYVWVTYTRSNPSHDIYGVKSFTEFKHWGCEGPLIIDARVKPHHAPPLIKDENVERAIDRIFQKGGSLYGKLPSKNL